MLQAYPFWVALLVRKSCVLLALTEIDSSDEHGQKNSCQPHRLLHFFYPTCSHDDRCIQGCKDSTFVAFDHISEVQSELDKLMYHALHHTLYNTQLKEICSATLL